MVTRRPADERGNRKKYEPPPRRRASGDGEPRRVGKVIRQTTSSIFAEGLLLGRLVRAWPEVVGSDLAARSRPASLEARTLVIGAESSAWAVRVRFAEAEIRRLANEHLGRDAVSRIRVVITPAKMQNP